LSTGWSQPAYSFRTISRRARSRRRRQGSCETAGADSLSIAFLRPTSTRPPASLPRPITLHPLSPSVVVLKPQTPSTFLAAHLAQVAASPSLDGEDAISNVYDSEHLVGYAGKFDADTLDLIRRQAEVDFVELDSVVTTMETELGAPWVRA
jgi:hypothetical protein